MAEMLVESIEQYGLSSESKPQQLFSKVGIVGGGSVGQKIALMISKSDLEVTIIELDEERIQQAISNIECELDAMIATWGMTSSEKRAILTRIKGSTDYSSLKECDIIIECVRSRSRVNHIQERVEIFKKIEQIVSDECIIATNSNSIVITELSAELNNKARTISLHFLTNTNANIIEVVRGLHTSEETYDRVLKFIAMLGKEPVPCEESAGLISVRMFVAQLNEACGILMEGVGCVDDIDKSMRQALGQILGPFEMADKIGLDKIIRWMDNMYREFGDRKYVASPIIKRLVRANQLGRKTGKGFYVYEGENKKVRSNIQVMVKS